MPNIKDEYFKILREQNKNVADPMELLASATNELNTWARELGVDEAGNESEILPLIQRLIAKCNSDDSMKESLDEEQEWHT